MIKKFLKIIGVILSLFIIPIWINYFTDTVTYNDIWNNGWMITSILLFSFLVIALIVLFQQKNNKSKKPDFSPNTRINQNDIDTYKRLVSILNLDNTEYYLRDMQNNLPISITDIKMFVKFITESTSVKNRIVNPELRQKVESFTIALSNFMNKRAAYTSPLKHDDELCGFDPDFKQDNYPLYEKRVNELDDLATEAYKKLKELIIFAKEKDIIHN